MRVAYLAENLGRVERAWTRSAAQIVQQTGGNVGNMAFWYAARLLFEEEPVLVGRNTRARDVPADVGAMVIPAANFLNQNANLASLAELVRGLDKPCLVVGLGAQSEREDRPPKLTEGVIEFLAEISRRTPSIGVRGPFSAEVCALNGAPNTAVLGCPSLLINPDPTLGAQLEARMAAVRTLRSVSVSGACIKPNTRSVERELVRLVQLHPGASYIVQRPHELIKAGYDEPMEGPEAEYFRSCAEFLGFSGGPAALAGFLRAHLVVPDSIDGWIHHLRGFDAAVNTRIHGTMMALAAGTPCVCIAHDTRTRELTQVMNVPTIDVAGFLERRYSIRDVLDATNFSGAAFDANRRRIAAGFAEMVKAAGLTVSRHLRGFLDS